MQQRLAFFSPHLSIGIAENESNRGEEVTLARAITANDHVALGRERLYDGLFLITV